MPNPLILRHMESQYKYCLLSVLFSQRSKSRFIFIPKNVCLNKYSLEIENRYCFQSIYYSVVQSKNQQNFKNYFKSTINIFIINLKG